MNAKLIVFVFIGLAIGTLAAISVLPRAQQALPPSGQVVSGKALVGGPFSLVDNTGKRVTDKDFSGRYMLVFFGFTSCPDICPAGLQLISAALEKIGPKADRVVPIFISVDPERDTPAKLDAYLKSFSPRLVGLTGTPAEIAAAAKAYRVYYNKVPSQNGSGDYTMDHTAIMYLMNPEGEFVTHFAPTTSVDDLATQLDKTL